MFEYSRKAQREIEEVWKLRREAVELLGVVVAEWISDPASVQCFDLRTVQRAKEVTSRLAVLETRNSLA